LPLTTLLSRDQRLCRKIHPHDMPARTNRVRQQRRPESRPAARIDYSAATFEMQALDHLLTLNKLTSMMCHQPLNCVQWQATFIYVDRILNRHVCAASLLLSCSHFPSGIASQECLEALSTIPLFN